MRVTTTMHNAVRTVSSHVSAMAMFPIMPPSTLIPAIPSKCPCTSARQPVHSDGHSFLDIRILPIEKDNDGAANKKRASLSQQPESPLDKP